MRPLTLLARLLLGAGFVLFGANMFYPFLPLPAHAPGSLPMQYMQLMGSSHWMQLVGAVQVAGGALVLFGGTAPLGLALLSPVLVNILAFHVFLMHGEGIAPGLLFSALATFLIWRYWRYFAQLWTAHARP